MKKYVNILFSKITIPVLVGLFLIFASEKAIGVSTFTATQSGNWNDGATWGHISPGVAGTDYPNTTDHANISSNWNLTVTLQANTSCANITIQNGCTLALNNFNFSSTDRKSTRLNSS